MSGEILSSLWTLHEDKTQGGESQRRCGVWFSFLIVHRATQRHFWKWNSKGEIEGIYSEFADDYILILGISHLGM